MTSLDKDRFRENAFARMIVNSILIESREEYLDSSGR